MSCQTLLKFNSHCRALLEKNGLIVGEWDRIRWFPFCHRCKNLSSPPLSAFHNHAEPKQVDNYFLFRMTKWPEGINISIELVPQSVNGKGFVPDEP